MEGVFLGKLSQWDWACGGSLGLSKGLDFCLYNAKEDILVYWHTLLFFMVVQLYQGRTAEISKEYPGGCVHWWLQVGEEIPKYVPGATPVLLA